MTQNRAVAVASRSFSKHETLRRELLERYPRASFNESGRSLSGEDLVAFLRGHARAITALERLDAALFDAVPELRVVSKYGVGLDMIDLPEMDRRGIALGWTPGVNRRSVAELVISSAIALLHQAPRASREVAQGQWRQITGRELTGRTVGVIGCGHVGKEVAVLARAFGCRVLAHDLLEFPEFYARYDVRPVDLGTLLRMSDVVTLHLPLDSSTHRLLDDSKLSLMRPDAILINMARGGIVDEAALERLLRNGSLGGAALDVLEQEPSGTGQFVGLANVIVTPHIGGSSEEAILAMGRAAIDGLENARSPREHGLI